MSLRAWLNHFVTAGALAWSVGIALPGTSAAQQPEPPAQNVPRLPDVDVVAEPPAQTPVFAQDDFFPPQTNVVTDNLFNAGKVDGYRAEGSTTGSLIAVPDLRFPGTINTVTKDLIKDQQALRFNDVLRNIGGASNSNDDRLRPDSFLLRGLEMTSYNFRKDGFLDNTYSPRDFANVERVDVLKGPASVLYGIAQPAGIVNLVTKSAQQDRFAYGSATFGSYALQRYQIDANSMGPNENLLVRVNAAWEERNTFRNFSYNDRIFVAPTASLILGPDTVLTWKGEYLHDERRADSGIIAVNGDARFFGEDKYFGTRDDFQQFHDYRTTLYLTHKFNDNWQLYFGGMSLFYDAPGQITNPQTGFTTTLTPQGFYANAGGLGSLLNRSQNAASEFREHNHSIISNIAGIFDTGPFTHNMVAGYELDWFVVNRDIFDTSIPGLDPALTFDPNGADPFAGGTVSKAFRFDNPAFRQDRYGFYLQDMMQVTDRLTLLGSVRADLVNQTYARTLSFGGFPIFGPVTTNQQFDRVSPRAGLVYEWVPGALSSYYVYTNSFNPPGGSIFAQTPQPLLPELGRIHETGVKANIFENLTANIGLFYIERDNVAVQLNNTTVVTGASQRSRGVEFNLVGRWSERLSTISNYTYADVDQLGPATNPELNGRVRGNPFNLANTWTRYNLIQDEDRTFGVGLGYIMVGDRRGAYNTPLRLDGYNRWDLGIFGRLGAWELNSYVENIFNIRYETGSIDQYQIYPGAPTNFRLQLGVLF